MRTFERLTQFVALAVATLGAANTASAQGNAKFDQAMQPVLADYLKIQAALASDSDQGVAAAAASLGKTAKKVDPKTAEGEHAKHFAAIPAKLEKAAKALAQAKDIAAMREALKEVSKPMAMWATVAKPKGVDVVFCSMAKGSWLQPTGEIRNPYYGKSMLNCGEVVGGAAHAASAKPAGEHQH